jgi:hypothetical protein
MFHSLEDFPTPDAAADGSPDDTRATDSGADHDAQDARGESTPKDAEPDVVIMIEPAFYVATNGLDSNPGTIERPFRTLTRAQTAMQGSSKKTTYIRAGSYTFSTSACGGVCGLSLGTADEGETWSYYPPDGVDSADFSGGATDGGTGLSVVISVGANDVTINGLSIHDFQYAAINSGGGANNLTVENCIVFNGYASPPGNPGGISCYGCGNAVISHNVIHDMATFGVSISSANEQGIPNLRISDNVIYNTCKTFPDCGAIYAQDTTAMAKNVQWTNNFVRDGNLSATLESGTGAALYAADCLSNVSVSGNVIAGRNGANTVEIQGGSSIRLVDNLTDLATYQQNIAAFVTSSAAGCSGGATSGLEYENNIIISAGGGGGYAQLMGTLMNLPTITNNDYYSYGSEPVSSNGAYSDSNPVSKNPKLSGWTYEIASGSPVLGAPVKFVRLTGGWGPPGYSIPMTGTPPSCPHP